MLVNNPPIVDVLAPLESIVVPEGAPFGFVHDKFLFWDPDVGDYIDVVYMIEDDGVNPSWILYHGATYSVVGVAPDV